MREPANIELRIEANGILRTVREIFGSLPDLPQEERSRQIAELEAACNVEFGEDEKAWDEWLKSLRERGVEPSGPLPAGTRVEIAPDSKVLAGLIEAAVEEQATRSHEPLKPLRGYKLIEEVGSGGMATVFKAVQLSLDRTVALKILSPRLAADEAFIRRFLREAKIAATLSHPNIVTVYDAGSVGEKYYLAMEFIEGETLLDVIHRESWLPEREALEIALQVANALEHARQRGLIHRDVKPGNILIGRNGGIKLADMGLARTVTHSGTKTTRFGQTVGTPQYMAPEQCLGESDLDTRTDIYGLGATLFCALAGRPPFIGGEAIQIMDQHVNDEPVLANVANPEVSLNASLVVRKALEKERRLRYQTPSEMASDLAQVIAGKRPRLAWTQYQGAAGFPFNPLSWRPATKIGVAAAVAVLVAGILLRTGTPAESPVEKASVVAEPLAELVSVERKEDIEVAAKDTLPIAPQVEGPPSKLPAEKPALAQPELLVMLDEAQHALATGRYRAAIERSEAALALEPANDQALSIRKAAMEALYRDSELKSLLLEARAALDESRWQNAAVLAEKALTISDEKSARDIRSQALAKIEAEERMIESSLVEVRKAFDPGHWKSVVEHADDILALRPDHAEAVRMKQGAARAVERETALASAQDAKLKGQWIDVKRHAKAALLASPDDTEATRLARRAEFELALPREAVGTLAMELVLVPAGRFTMGADDGEESEGPSHRLWIDSFYIGRHEVTNAQFAEFDPAHMRRWRRFSPAPDMPAVCVTWEEAVAFCQWLSEKSGESYRLPTEAEWEKAARGVDARLYPWGDDFPTETMPRANYASEGGASQLSARRYVKPVGSFPGGMSPWGALDMAGNVWEWCADWYSGNAYHGRDGSKNPSGPADGIQRVLRGGSFGNAAGGIRTTTRTAHEPGFREAAVGFRVVRDIRLPESLERD